MKVSPKLASLTMELNKTKKIFGVKGLKYPSKEKNALRRRAGV